MEAATKLRLWEISDVLDEVAEAIIAAGGELTPQIEARLEAMEGAFEEKCERVALFIRECEANAAAAEIEEKRLAAIRKSFETKASGLKGYLQYFMTRTGRTTLKTPRVRVWSQKNGRPSIRFVGNMDTLPTEYVRVKREVDTQFAYVEHMAGSSLPEGFIVEHGTHIRIG